MSVPMNANWWEKQSLDFVDDYGLLLVTLNHPQLAEPIRVNASDMDVFSNGENYVGWPLAPRLPSAGDRQKRGGLRFGNVDHRIGRLVLGLKGEVEVSFAIVEREALDVVIYTHGGLKLTNVRTEGGWIVADVVGQGSHGLAFPRSTATPEYAPGVFVA
jgi:hypothetical protein